MKFFDKWFLRQWVKAQRYWTSPDSEAMPVDDSRKMRTYASNLGRGNTISASKAAQPNHANLETRGMSFTIYRGNGGHVLEYNYYNEKTDRHEGSLHLITDAQDMGKIIEHAITMELLKQ
jgi:hypothetical protein